MQIVLIEDNDLVREATRRFLTSQGATVEAAELPADAINWARAAAVRPDLIIADFWLPGQLNGRDAIARLRAVLAATVPAILLTGDTSGASRLALNNLEAVRLLHKPVVPSILLDTIEELTGRQLGATPKR